jgi:4-alpha-glucanotransferase
LLISPDRLVEEGYLPVEALAQVPDFRTDRVDYGPVIEYKNDLLRQAHEHFRRYGTDAQRTEYDAFCTGQHSWLDDYALFMAVKSYHMHDRGGVWNTWPSEIAFRQPAAMAGWSEELAEQVSCFKFQQFLFFQQWLALKRRANEQGIRIIGDAPIFVAFDSADVWADRDLYDLKPDGSPRTVAGVPPDYFSETGQRWGNPLYRWERMAEDGYGWWAARLAMLFTQVDIVRVDHFRGFEGYWRIPAEEPTAVIGRWVRGPGASFFHAVQATLGTKYLPIIAEDLGVITPRVERLRDRFGFPGMKILQFAFGGEQNSRFLPHNYETPNCAVYTGTHDNETTAGWYENANEKERDFVRRYLAREGTDMAWDMIRLAYSSVADTAVIPMQDLMSLGNEARMNYPSKASGNWQWRYTDDMLAKGLEVGLSEFAELYGRAPVPDAGDELAL